MGHPGAVEALARLPFLVRPDLREGTLVDLGVVPAGDERAHPADGERARRWRSLHEVLGVRLHEGRRHPDAGAVREDVVRSPVTEPLDDAEQVVPATGVETDAWSRSS